MGMEASNNLWVGNLAADVSEADLIELFCQYGSLHSVTAYTSRSYAFVFFNQSQDASAAKQSLNGFSLCGSPLKIQFARPAKPSNHLWVGGISPSLSHHQLHHEFSHFGLIHDFKLLRDRNTAFIQFSRLEDASRALSALNGKRLCGDQLRVDFLRSQPSSSSSSRKEQPSKVLWIGYPPTFQIDEQMLHNAMILFGEIETIRTFPSRNHSLVQFRSVDEARRAKEGLQGRLFNDSRITIIYSTAAEVGPDGSGRDSKRARTQDNTKNESYDFIWRGIIAKGGTPVCNVRCLPVGRGLASHLPQVVNCSARTGLDMLTKHYADAIGYEIAFFLPDSEDDFASYTEFLRYLGAKNRAGVAKLDDGTTLFLVPPSEFLTKVLNVDGPERLYGVVLKFPNQPHVAVTAQYADRPPKEEGLFMEYGSPKPQYPPFGDLAPTPLPQYHHHHHHHQSYPSDLNDTRHNGPQSLVPEPSNQVQSQGEVDKNQRYQSTLQFAANLLLQIQQQQHQQPTRPNQ